MDGWVKLPRFGYKYIILGMDWWFGQRVVVELCMITADLKLLMKVEVFHGGGSVLGLAVVEEREDLRLFFQFLKRYKLLLNKI